MELLNAKPGAKGTYAEHHTIEISQNESIPIVVRSSSNCLKTRSRSS
jgi:hypothetical protein